MSFYSLLLIGGLLVAAELFVSPGLANGPGLEDTESTERITPRHKGITSWAGAQIKSLLRIAKTRAEFVQPRVEEFGAFHLLVGIGVCPHEKEQQLWILGRRGAVDRFEVFELWACRARLSLVRADSDRCIFSEGSQKSRAEHQHEDEKDKLSHWGNPFRRMILRNDRCIYIYYGTRIYAPVAAFVAWATVVCICFQPEGPNVFRKRRSAAAQCG
jgi:hypothetical protein